MAEQTMVAEADLKALADRTYRGAIEHAVAALGHFEGRAPIEEIAMYLRLLPGNPERMTLASGIPHPYKEGEGPMDGPLIKLFRED